MADIRLCQSADPGAGESGLLSAAFYDYVRGLSDEVPAGYTENGMRLYRHLVYLGADQMLGGYFPDVKQTLGDESWRSLLCAFIQSSAWQSHFYGDMTDEFIEFLKQQAAG